MVLTTSALKCLKLFKSDNQKTKKMDFVLKILSRYNKGANLYRLSLKTQNKRILAK